MASVGDRLRQERLQQGLTLDEVHRRLRINPQFLEALEAEEFDKLPGRFFARSFLRQYAAFLGLEEEAIREALAGLERTTEAEAAGLPAAPASPIEVPRIELNPKARREALKRWLSSVAALLAVVLVCAAAYAVWQRLRTTPPPAPEPIAQPAAQPVGQPAAQPAAQTPGEPSAKPPTETATQPAEASSPSATSPPSPPSPEPAQVTPIVLELKASQETWIRATTDGKVAFTGTLQPGQSRAFQAQQSLSLLTGNAGGLEAVFNGRPLGPLGPPGQIRVLELTPAEHRILERKPPPEP